MIVTEPFRARSELTTSLKRALVVLLEEGQLTRQQGFWVGKNGHKCFLVTIEALYDRYLVKIVAESNAPRRAHRRADPSRMRYLAILTDVGEWAARGIKHEYGFPVGTSPIAEHTALFITEVVG